MPFMATMHLIYALKKQSSLSGLSKEEFSIFVPTLINANEIAERVRAIIKFRDTAEKSDFIDHFIGEFYEIDKPNAQQKNTLYDYGDNIMRYFRLTKYFRVTTDQLGSNWRIDLEPLRAAEIEQLLKMYDGSASSFNLEGYLTYISDIAKPKLPWEEILNLRKIANSLKTSIIAFAHDNEVDISTSEEQFLNINPNVFDQGPLEKHISELRKLNLDFRLRLQKKQLRGNYEKIRNMICLLRNPKGLRGYAPEEFEKLLTEALRIINDDLLIKPNYPIDDNGDPIGHAPGNKADLECYYETFNATCEVTLDTGRLQWVREGQPVMRHLRDFENLHKETAVFCLFIAPLIHKDTRSQFWISVRHGYDGKTQKIIPLSTAEFSEILEVLSHFLHSGRPFSHRNLRKLYDRVIAEADKTKGFTEWELHTATAVQNWKEEILQ